MKKRGSYLRINKLFVFSIYDSFGFRRLTIVSQLHQN